MSVLGKSFDKVGSGAKMQFFLKCDDQGDAFIVLAYADDHFPQVSQLPWVSMTRISDPITVYQEITCKERRAENMNKSFFFRKSPVSL